MYTFDPPYYYLTSAPPKSQALSSSSVLARPPAHCEDLVAGESPTEGQLNQNSLYADFLQFMDFRKSFPSRSSVIAPVSSSAPTGPVSVSENPSTIVPGPNSVFDHMRGSSPA